jgi:5-methylcytosine-specific restriction endonuclease McrBC GTP-binding regulatory subunit McrB
LESETYRLGSIWGGSSLKFGIYRYDQVPKEGMPAKHDDKYCWLAKYNCETSEEAFNIVRDKIATIAEKAVKGDLQGVEDIDFGDVVKWKIACLYSDRKVINMYTKELLQAAAKGFGYKGDLNSRPETNEFITAQ